MNKKTAVFQGTFDPFTQGHLQILHDALKIFDEVIILLLVNPAKKPLFSVEERKNMILETIKGLKGVKVDHFQGLLVEYMKKHELYVCVRGIRNEQDWAYEVKNHMLSKELYPALQTLFLPCSTQNSSISSSAVKQTCLTGQIPQNWVPMPVAEALKKKFIG